MKSDFVDFLGLFQFNEKYMRVGLRREARRDRHHDPRPVAAHHPVRDPGARASCRRCTSAARSRGPTSTKGRRRLQAKIDLRAHGRARARASGSPTSARAGASRAPGRRRCCRRSSARCPQYFAGTSNVLVRHAQRPDAARHHGARIHAGLPGARAAAARLADLRLRQVGAGVPRRPRHRASPTPTASDAFLRDFDMYFCKLFDGVRHDSGDPFDWGEKLIAHYRKNRVDPRTKTLDLLRPALVPARDRDRAPLPRPRASPRSASAPTSPTTSATSRSTS